MNLHDLALRIQDSALSTALRESQYAFPLIEAAHLLGLALSFGLILLTDLRLTGLLLRQMPLAELLQQLRWTIFGGFALTFVTGGLLFWAEAETLYSNLPFWLKVGCMVVACINALVFELRWGGHRAAQWASGPVLPAGASRAGWISLVFWSLAAVFGRSIPYY
jgi:hypothetical protein